MKNLVLAGAILGLAGSVLALEVRMPAKKSKHAAFLTERPNPGFALVPVGETCVIQLRGNPTTGYQWELASIDREVVEPVGPAEYQQNQSKRKMVGAGGTYYFVFRGIKPGKTQAVLVYRRSWEKAKPAKTYKADIQVLPENLP